MTELSASNLRAGKAVAPEDNLAVALPDTAGKPIRMRVKAALDVWAAHDSALGEIGGYARSVARATYSNRWLYLTDLIVVGTCLVLATLFRLNLNQPQAIEYLDAQLQISVPMIVSTAAVIFPVAGVYHRNWRYVSLADLVSVIWAAILTLLVFVTCLFVFTRLHLVPRSIVPLSFLLLIPALTAVRLRSRLTELSFASPTRFAKTKANKHPVVIVGAGEEANNYLRALQHDPHAPYTPVGLIDNQEAVGTRIRGVPVLGNLSEFKAILKKLEGEQKRPRHLIFSKSTSEFSANSADSVVSLADSAGIAVSRLPSSTELRSAKNATKYEVRPLELTDLLERPQKALNYAAIKRLLNDRKILITGAGGSIGSELTRQIAACNPAEIILVESTEFNLYQIDLELGEKFPDIPRRPYLCNVRDANRVNEIFAQHEPHLVFHAAALKHVPMVESNPCEGFLTNVIGTMNVADAARKTGVLAMVQISTDKVVNPTSVMGLTKRLAESYCQALDLDNLSKGEAQRFLTVRFGNVLGSSGSLIPLFQRQISQGGPLTVTHQDMTRFFMTIREAVELTLHASASGLEKRLGRGEIFVLDMGKPVKILDIAKRMISLAGYTPEEDVKIKIVGCRPGEKLFEELFDENEEQKGEAVEGVMSAVPVAFPVKTLQSAFKDLKAAAERADQNTVFDVVREFVPGYQPPTAQLLKQAAE